jgi:5-methylcytosine-specific restriction protein A
MRADLQELQKWLKRTDMACVPAGQRSTSDEIYPAVKQAHPDLCDDKYRCDNVCDQGNDQPEWKHAVRRVQQQLARRDDSRVSRSDETGLWEIGPLFDEGETYDRRELHEQFGGNRYSGIAPCADYPFVFLFTGSAGEEHGYEDEFHGDTFLYTGEGQTGDMEMDGGNQAIRDHQQNSNQLHLFENTDEAWQVVYVGQFEYADHFWERLPDTEGNMRDAVRFKLEPASGAKINLDTGDLDSLSDEEVYERAKEAGTTQTGSGSGGGSSTSTTRTSYSRSEVVKRYAKRVADGLCQGCGEEAPFIDEDGEPFLEVHHLYRRSDGGADDPDNVIALCPNCHRRVHHGEDGDAFNERLIQQIQKDE